MQGFTPKGNSHGVVGKVNFPVVGGCAVLITYITEVGVIYLCEKREKLVRDTM
jgi:hypothetical protein